jgi:hypothetical protein
LGNWAADNADEILKLGNIDALTAYVRVSFSNEGLEGMNVYSLIEFNRSYSYWKDDIYVKAVAYLYIGGLKVGALRAYLMTDWHAGNYDYLIALHNDVAKNSFWRSAFVNIPKNSSSATTHNRGKAHVPKPSYKRPHGSIGQ